MAIRPYPNYKNQIGWQAIYRPPGQSAITELYTFTKHGRKTAEEKAREASKRIKAAYKASMERLSKDEVELILPKKNEYFFGDYARKWFARKKLARGKDTRHLKQLESKLENEIIPFFSGKKVQAIDDEDILNCMRQTDKGAKNRFKLIREILVDLEKRHIISKSPHRLVPREALKGSAGSRTKAYFPNEIERIEKVAKEEGLESETIIAVFKHTGARQESVWNIKLSDIHLNEEKPFLYVYHGKSKTKEEDEVKIWIHEELETQLRKWFKVIGEREYLFVNPQTGNPYSRRDSWFHSVLKKANVQEIPGRLFHGFRHAFVIRAKRAGIRDDAKIKKITGHKSWQAYFAYLKDLSVYDEEDFDKWRKL